LDIISGKSNSLKKAKQIPVPTGFISLKDWSGQVRQMIRDLFVFEQIHSIHFNQDEREP
jgi:hypothetical protein